LGKKKKKKKKKKKTRIAPSDRDGPGCEGPLVAV